MTAFSLYQQFIHMTRYSRWLWDQDRRETWDETVDRYVDFIANITGPTNVMPRIRSAIYNMDVMPSMRALMTAGPALEGSHVAGFNCSYLVFDNLRSFDELLFILMNGTGVGFSVENRYVSQLPVVPEHFVDLEDIHVVQDSKYGWAEAFRYLIQSLYNGEVPKFDYSEVRGAGEPLKTFGGRASGPDPLIKLIDYTIAKVKGAAGRRLKTIEVHDIACTIATCVVVGGVRRSALISLSDLDDVEMRDAKSGPWWETAPERALANNSAVYEGPITRDEFDSEWAALIASGSGERGIFNRTAARLQAQKAGRDPSVEYGTNPCGEILLRPNEFCNLTEVIARDGDTIEELREKVEIATILGTIQATLTDYKYLRSIWKENVDEERLLGVSITGIYDCPTLHDANVLQELKELSHEINREWAERLDINPSASVTCVKPSGTVSQLTNSASGIHPRYAEFYIRRVRNDCKDPVTKFLESQGFECEVDAYNSEARVFSFPVKAPDQASFREDLTALDHLRMWSLFKSSWCDHNPSITVSIRPDEWQAVGDWVYDNFEEICGVSFLPYSTEDHTYVQLPYEEITEDRYWEMVGSLPVSINWSDLAEFEDGGKTVSAGRELACTAGACEL